MPLLQIKYQPAQYPISPWWEDFFGTAVRSGHDNFRGIYQDRPVIVIQQSGRPPLLLNESTLKPIIFDYKIPIAIHLDSTVAEAIFDTMKSKE